MAESTTRGKWALAGVPHKGWRFLHGEDRGRDHAICEMCESSSIRFVHFVEHDDYPGELAVGCICAGHLTSDMAGAERRDQSMKSRAGKRSRWLTRRWKTSAKGNAWISVDGYRVVIRPSGNGFAATVAKGDEKPVHGNRVFSTPDAAKLAAFDHISRLLS